MAENEFAKDYCPYQMICYVAMLKRSITEK